jgi:hypothetical protein
MQNMTGPYRSWMVAWCWSVVAIGLIFAAGVIPALRTPTLLYLDLVTWPFDGQPETISTEAIFAFGILGAITAGWGVMMTALVTDPVIGREPRFWRVMTMSIVAWFVLLAAVSVLAGLPANIMSGANLLLTYLYPVWRGRLMSDVPPTQD